MPYPGGAQLDAKSKQGDENRYPLPRIRLEGNPYDMSFSGLKTAAINQLHHLDQLGEPVDIPGMCASFSKAVSDMLVPRTMRALAETGHKKLAIAGGVAANSRIRETFDAETARVGVQMYVPPLQLCGDNAAMIGAQGYYEYLAGNLADQTLNAYATKSMEGERL